MNAYRSAIYFIYMTSKQPRMHRDLINLKWTAEKQLCHFRSSPLMIIALALEVSRIFEDACHNLRLSLTAIEHQVVYRLVRLVSAVTI